MEDNGLKGNLKQPDNFTTCGKLNLEIKQYNNPKEVRRCIVTFTMVTKTMTNNMTSSFHSEVGEFYPTFPTFYSTSSSAPLLIATFQVRKWMKSRDQSINLDERQI